MVSRFIAAWMASFPQRLKAAFIPK